MPIVYVYAFERPLAKKREIVKGITEVTCKAYDVPPEIVTVYIFDVPRTNAAHAGILESDRQAAAKVRKGRTKKG
ncbi:MAG: tautomerase family protein [Pseudomonadota bacterium]